MEAIERLRSVLDYDPNTGEFRWRVSRGRAAKGSRAGSQHDKQGYRSIRYQGVTYYEHRLAIAFATGNWPSLEIDHINRNTCDNRLSNLRSVKPRANSANRKDNSPHGVGVYPRKSGRFQAQIKIDGKRRYLGTYDTAEQARRAYALEASRV